MGFDSLIEEPPLQSVQQKAASVCPPACRSASAQSRFEPSLLLRRSSNEGRGDGDATEGKTARNLLSFAKKSFREKGQQQLGVVTSGDKYL